MKPIEQVPAWQQEKSMVIHRRFMELERRAKTGEKVKAIVAEIADDLADRTLIVRDPAGAVLEEKPFRASEKNLWTLLAKWREGGRCPEALVPGYKSAGSHRPMPTTLKAEIQRRATNNLAGHDSKGRAIMAGVYKDLCKEWMAGKFIQGLGTWQDFWREDPRTKGLPLPPVAPEFPWCERTFRRHCGSRALRDRGNRGDAAGKKHLPHVQINYAHLRKCELYTLDDKRIDHACIDDAGNPVECFAYLLMEVASRSIVAVTLKPGSGDKRLHAEDVDELLARGLSTPGFGIGVGYTTHIKFERGDLACTEHAQMILESGSGGGIKVHRTSMDGDVVWAGTAADKQSGHWAGKAVIESFMRNLDNRLQSLPGARGNHYQNSPANLGFEDRHSVTKRDTLTKQAKDLGLIRADALRRGEKSKIILPFLLFSQLSSAVMQAVRDHNESRGHGFQGFSSVAELEVAPGVWMEVEGSLRHHDETTPC